MQKRHSLPRLEPVRRGWIRVGQHLLQRLDLEQFPSQARQPVQAQIVDDAIEPGGEAGL
jgi:hypothetical protein